MREAFGCGFYPGPDQQPRSNKTVYGNAVWQRLQHQNDLAINNATRSKQEQQQTPTRSRQGHHALGVDGKLLMELLDIALASGTTDPHRELHRDLRPSWCLGSFGGSTLPPNRIASGSNAFVRHILRRMLFQQVAIWQVAGPKEDRTAMLSVHFAKQGRPMQWPVMPCGS